MVWTTQRCTRAFWIALWTSYSNEGQRVQWDQPETPFDSTMKNAAANILMSLPETAPAAAGVTPAGTHIEEID